MNKLCGEDYLTRCLKNGFSHFETNKLVIVLKLLTGVILHQTPINKKRESRQLGKDNLRSSLQVMSKDLIGLTYWNMQLVKEVVPSLLALVHQ